MKSALFACLVLLFTTQVPSSAHPVSPQSAPPQAGQQAKPPAGARQQAPHEGVQTPAPPQQPTFHVTVQLVRTDVVVRDANGNFVSDLKPADFAVYEDGVRQDVASLELVHGGRVFSLAAAPPPPTEEGLILPAARPTSDTSGRIFLFFVDDLHLSFETTSRLRRLFRKISTELVHDGDEFGIVSTGPSSLAIDLTYDRRVLDEAINKISGAGLRPGDIINGPQSSEGPTEVRYRAQVAFSTALDLVANLEKVRDRRKAVIYVSEGYDFNPFSDPGQGDPAFAARAGQARQTAEQQLQQQGLSDPTTDPTAHNGEFADADLARELGELTRAANRANATFYTIDPRGLVGGPPIDEDQVDPVQWRQYVQKAHDSLRVLAEETGGIAVVDQNNFDRALKRIDAETSDYYMLSYYPKDPDPTHRIRRIDVKVTRPGLTVWSRKSYALRPAGATR
jgi:VWFA-related protein